LSESEPGIYGSTEGTVVEVSFQYDVVTNKTLQSSTYTEIVQNIEMKLSAYLVDSLMTPCENGGIHLSKAVELGGVSCYPADIRGGVPFDTEDGHLCSPMNGTVSVYFTGGDISDQDFIIESYIKGIFEDGLINSAHTDIFETHYRPKDYGSSSQSAGDNFLGDDETCHSYLEEADPGVYGDCKSGTLTGVSFQYNVVTNPVSKPTYQKMKESLEMRLSFLLSRDLGPSCENDQDPVEELARKSRSAVTLGGVSCYPADESESEPVDTPDGHLCSPMNGFVSVYVLDNNTGSEEMIVQTSIRKIMDYDKLLSVHPDIIAVDYVSRILPDNDMYLNIDAKVEANSWTKISFVAIGIAAAGFVFGLISIWLLVKRQRKKSSQLNDDSKSVYDIDQDFVFTISAFTPRSLSASDATVKMSNKSLSLSTVKASDLDESSIGSTGKAFDEIYAFDDTVDVRSFK